MSLILMRISPFVHAGNWCYIFQTTLICLIIYSKNALGNDFLGVFTSIYFSFLHLSILYLTLKSFILIFSLPLLVLYKRLVIVQYLSYHITGECSFPANIYAYLFKTYPLSNSFCQAVAHQLKQVNKTCEIFSPALPLADPWPC